MGSDNFVQDFSQLFYAHPEVVEALPLLMADRDKKVFGYEDNGKTHRSKTYSFKKPYDNVDDYLEFLEKSGLRIFLESGTVTDLQGYLAGVEVGSDSHGRKIALVKPWKALLNHISV